MAEIGAGILGLSSRGDWILGLSSRGNCILGLSSRGNSHILETGKDLDEREGPMFGSQSPSVSSKPVSSLGNSPEAWI